MARTKQIEQVQTGEIMDPGEVVRGQLDKLREQFPALVSFDVSTREGQLLAIRCTTDPGIPAQARDGWRGTVLGWYVGPYDVVEQTTGEVVTLPSLVLLADDGTVCRLTGWPAINSWVCICKAAAQFGGASGIPVKVFRRQSGTAGRSYWQVLPDAMPSAPGSL